MTKPLLSASPDVLAGPERARRQTMLFDDIQARTFAANQRESEAWAAVDSVAGWERFRDERIGALRESIGPLPDAPADLRIETTGELSGERFLLRKLVFETRPGLLAAAHLYLPDPVPDRMPAVLICHAHHRPKEQAELQDMGVNWARSGCAVLVPDVLGHGERGQQPFGGRQDYYSRYFINMHLYLAGESYMGWIVWDLMRCLDLMLGLPKVDAERVILLGAVAGGGDPAAVTAALDRRVTCSIPYNFGAGSGWRTNLARPAPAGRNLASDGGWESTRNLPLTARDGFFPWVIVAAAAPRCLVYAHEFAWDPESDEAWRRIQKVYQLYGASERVAACHGAGRCEPGPGNTHCTNIGPVHRAGFYPFLEHWFGMAPPLPEVQARRQAAELVCFSDEHRRRNKPVRLLAAERAAALLESMRSEVAGPDAGARRRAERERWAELLGDTEPAGEPRAEMRGTARIGAASAERILLEVEPDLVVPLVFLKPVGRRDSPLPVVVAVAQQGKAALLRDRAAEVDALVRRGIAVALPEVRGTGETRPDDERGRGGLAITACTEELMLGRVLLGLQLRDLRAVLRYLRGRPDLDAARFAAWGDSTAAVNPADFVPPRQHGDGLSTADDGPSGADRPPVAEPLGGLLALLAALFENDVRAVLVRRSVAAFACAFESHSMSIPHDCIAPGMLAAGDVDDLAAAVAPVPLRLEALVDACNRPLAPPALAERFQQTMNAYLTAPEALALVAEAGSAAEWLAGALVGGAA